MQTQAPKRSSVLIAALFALSCVGLTIYVWVSFGGTLPFQVAGYEVHALFPNASNLATNADVRIAGVNVGKVVGISHTGLSTDATIKLQNGYVPLAANALAIIRNKTLLGETYIDLAPGTGNAPKIPDGGVIPTNNIGTIQTIDQVLGSFDAPTRAKFKTFLDEFATGLNGRGEDINNALGNLAPTAQDLNIVARTLDRQRAAVAGILGDGSGVLQALGSRASDLQRVVSAGDQVFAATAARDHALTATVRALPGFLGDLRTTLAITDRVAGQAGPTLHQLLPAAPLLRPALDAARTLAPTLRGTLRGLLPVIAALGPALPALNRVIDQVGPASTQITAAGEQLNPLLTMVAQYVNEVVAGFANVGDAFQASTPSRGGPLHYLRGIVYLSNEMLVGYPQRLGNNRYNPYVKPGGLAKLATGLDAYDCRNTANPTLVPMIGIGGPLPCHVQGPWTFQGLTADYPHVEPAKP